MSPRGIHRFNGLYRLTKTIKRSQNKIPNVAYSEVTEEPHNNPVMLIHRDKTNRSLYRILSRMHTRVQKRSQNAMLDDVSTVFRIYKYFYNRKVKLYDFWKQFGICVFLFYIPQSFETPEVLKYLGGFGLGKLRIINAENDELDQEACIKRKFDESSSPGLATDSFKQSNYMFRITK